MKKLGIAAIAAASLCVASSQVQAFDFINGLGNRVLNNLENRANRSVDGAVNDAYSSAAEGVRNSGQSTNQPTNQASPTWSNPDQGAAQASANPAAASKTTLTGFVDSLSSCAAYSVSYPHPNGKGLATNTIFGQNYGKCHVEYYLPENVTAKCFFTTEQTRRLSGNNIYQQAQAYEQGRATQYFDLAPNKEDLAQEFGACEFFQAGRRL